ncbi:MAG: tetratricopeptide repeat protein [Candidatus Berkelbacteria bacterium]|nr:tetratricopeptide repeat protein [Candidatus Berkelbacteria bacterium]
MYEIVIIICLAIIFAILFRKWSQTKPYSSENKKVKTELSDVSFLDKGERFFEEQNFREAERYYVKAVSDDPENPQIYGRLGIIYTKLDNLKDAKEAFNMAVKLDSENGYYQNNLGLVLYSLNRYKEAIIYFENAVKIDGKIARRWINLGLCYERLGETNKAKRAFKNAERYKG